MQVLPPAVAGIEDLPQIRQDIDDFAVAGQRAVAEMVDCAAFVIGLDDPLGDRRQRTLQLELDPHRSRPSRDIRATPWQHCSSLSPRRNVLTIPRSS